MADVLFDENTFMGYQVNTRLFWIIFTLMMVLFTSPLAHLPFLLGYGILTCVAVGMIAIVFNVAIPIYIAHRNWQKHNTESAKVIEFDPSKKEVY